MNLRALAAALLVTASSSALAADPVAAAGVADLLGPRSLGLAGGVGAVAGNEGIFVNPAAVAARKKYSVEALLLTERRGGTTAGQWLGSTVVDSASSPLTGTAAYAHALAGPQTGDLIILGFAGQAAERLHLGVQARYLSLGGAEPVKAVSADAGLLYEVSDVVSFGAAGYNLVPVSHPGAAPRAAAAGVAIGSDTSFKLTADWHGDFDRGLKTTNRYGVGAEYLLSNSMPLRAGWLKDETLDTSWWCAGVGLIAMSGSTGVALDVGYRQSLTRSDARVLGVSLRLISLDL